MGWREVENFSKIRKRPFRRRTRRSIEQMIEFFGSTSEQLQAPCSEEKLKKGKELGDNSRYKAGSSNCSEVVDKNEVPKDFENDKFEETPEQVEIDRHESMNNGIFNPELDKWSESSLESFEDLEELRNALEQMESDEEEIVSDEDISSGLSKSINNRNRNEKTGMTNLPALTEEAIICIMLISGSNRMKRKQYDICRRLFKKMICGICQVNEIGTALPSLSTYERSIKKYYEENVLIKSEILKLAIDRTKAGAKGSTMFENEYLVPVKFVKPTEWAVLDYKTPSIRNMIWGNCESVEDTHNIEDADIVQNRKQCLSQFRVSGKKTIDEPIKKGIILELKVTVGKNSQKMIESCGFENVTETDVNGENEFVIRTEIMNVSYACDQCSKEKIYKNKKYIERVDPGDIVIRIKTNEDVEATVTFKHINGEEDFENRLKLTYTKLLSKKRKASRINVFLNSVMAESLEDRTIHKTSNKGRLKDGKPYVVYRFLLFSDGFNAYQSRAGSMDGVYIILLGIPISKRNPTSCVRKLCLCPPGTNINDIIRELKDDIIDGMTNGRTVEINNEKTQIFLDLLGYIGDSPALASVVGSKGHNANIPCHLCIIEKSNDLGFGLKFFHDSLTDSRNPCLKRTYYRVEDIARNAQDKKEILDKLGLKSDESSLSVIRRAIIENKKNIPYNNEEEQILPGIFDEYRSSLISPDHVFLGLSSNLLNIVINFLEKADRIKLEAYVRCFLKEVVSTGSNCNVLNSNKNKVGTLTISEMYAIIYVLPFAFRATTEKYNKTNNKFKKNMKVTITSLCDNLSKCIIDCMFEPKKGISEEKDWDWYKSENKLVELLRNVERFEMSVLKLHNLNKESCEELDKPNLHRLRELFTHTIPCYGTVKHICELILEKEHQTAKKALKMSNQKNAQMQAMNDSIIDDFFSRLQSITSCIEKDGYLGPVEVEALRTIMLPKINTAINGYETLKELFEKMFSSDVRYILKRICKPLKNRNGDSYWACPKGKIKYNLFETKAIDEAEKIVMKYTNECLGIEKCSITNHSIARKMTPVGEGKHYMKKNEISAHDVIHMLVQESKEDQVFDGFRICSPYEKGNLTHFLCLSFFSINVDGRKNKDIFALCKKMTSVGETVAGSKMYRMEGSAYDVLIRLDNRVRRSHAIHTCWLEDSNGGKCQNLDGKIHHTESIVDGGTYILNSLRDGYPTRSA